jgi:hypothetical protein
MNTDTTSKNAQSKPDGYTLLADGALNREVVEAALLLAFEAGKWVGQVELEEFIERNSFFDAFLGSVYSSKSGGGVCHSVSIDDNFETRPVKYNLRSQKWRDGVRKSADEYVEKARLFVFQHLR